jgi:alkylation response protein AidB-like acyl-CoA dehydrogenase
VNPSFGGSMGAHTSIGTLPLVYFGTDAQKAAYLPRLASAELIGAYALTEPQSGSDALAARTSAVLTEDGRHYLLNGQKAWITNGGFADLFTIFAKVNGEHFTAFLVERSMGVKSGANEKKLGLDGSSTTALMLDDVRVPAENVLGTIGEGHKVAFNILNLGRVKLGTRNIAGAKLALGHAVRYARERRQFGRAIAEFGLIKQKLAEMAIRCYVGDAMVYRALGDVDRALEAVDPNDGLRVLKTIEGFAVECSINKVWTSEALAWVVDEALQVFGGNGYSREFPIERAYRDARITRIYEGTNEINRLIIPTRLLKHAGGRFTAPALRPGSGSVEGHGPVASERDLLGRMKGLAIGLLGSAADTYGESLKDAQEVLAHVADVIIEVYAVESLLARAEKMRGDEAAAVAVDIARVYTTDAAGRAAHAARQVTAALGERAPKLQAEPVYTMLSHPPIDTIVARRRIADAVIGGGFRMVLG